MLKACNRVSPSLSIKLHSAIRLIASRTCLQENTSFRRSSTFTPNADAATVALSGFIGICEGRFFNVSPGNLYSDVQKVRLDPAAGYKVNLLLKNVIPPDEPPKETKWIKRVQFKSELLSKFWGVPVYLGATVILPKGYDERSDVRYPVVYAQGYLGSPAFYFNEDPNSARQQEGLRASVECPARIRVFPGMDFRQIPALFARHFR